MSLFLLPDVFVFSGKGSGCDKDKPTLNRHTNTLNRFLSAKKSLLLGIGCTMTFYDLCKKIQCQ
jgi:hypothetical protein